MTASLGDVSLARFAVYLLISALSSTFVFWHANKRLNRRAMGWAVCTFFAPGLVGTLYFFMYWWRQRARRS